MLLKNLIIYSDHGIINNGWISLIDGKIAALGQGPIEGGIDGQGRFLLPGFIDQHIHGANGVDFMDADPEAYQSIVSYLPQEGVTGILATTMTQSPEAIIHSLQAIASFSKNIPLNQTKIYGVHLEGPFISIAYKGAQNEAHIQVPTIELTERFIKASDHSIRVITYAPENDLNLALTRYLVANNIVPSIGHSNAPFQTCLAAIKAGAGQFTHLYNGMPPHHHRKPSVVTAAMYPTSASVELICDGVHVVEDVIDLTYHQKGSSLITLISDANRGKGWHQNTFDLGGQTVYVKDKKATLADGTIAGSILNYDDGIRRFYETTHCSIEDIILMTSTNTAKRLHIDHLVGSISEGKIADLVLLDDTLHVDMTIINGQIAYQAKDFSK